MHTLIRTLFLFLSGFHICYSQITQSQITKTQLTNEPNEWIAAANMLYARQEHTSTLLENGKVLIVGWDFNEAELYDPLSDIFTPEGSTIHNHRSGFTATLLDNGKVLIAGGTNAQQYAELYDPVSGTFQLTGNLNSVHSYHTATKLNDGRVLIIGGQDQTGPQTLAVCEIYDPTSGTFTLTDSLIIDRSSHTATLLEDGNVLIAGGIQTTTPGNAIMLNSCELYNTISGVFADVQQLNHPRAGHQATLLNSGNVLITGGSWNHNYGELYNPLTGNWLLSGEMTVLKRSSHSATLIHNGKVLLAGGYVDTETATAELYNPVTNTFTAIDSMITRRQQHSAIKLPDGSVLVSGGYSNFNTINLTERYIVDTTEVVGLEEEVNSTKLYPNSFELYQNYPNPFNPSTRIQYQVSSNTQVTLKVYDVLGKEVATLVNEFKQAGVYEVEFNVGQDPIPDIVSGIYLYRFQAGAFVQTRKMIYFK